MYFRILLMLVLIDKIKHFSCSFSMRADVLGAVGVNKVNADSGRVDALM